LIADVLTKRFPPLSVWTAYSGSGLGAGPPSTPPLLVLKVAPWHGHLIEDPLLYWTVQGWWVQVALKAFHCPPKLMSNDRPALGCWKYAEVFPARFPVAVTKTYPAGA